MDSCESCKNFEYKDRYCKLLQINWMPENFGCNKYVSKEKGGTDYCEPKNKKLYGFCGNFTHIDDVDILPRIYKCPKCLYLFNGRDDPDKCPRCGANVKKGGAE